MIQSALEKDRGGEHGISAIKLSIVITSSIIKEVTLYVFEGYYYYFLFISTDMHVART
jgi:hypothetical protein